MKCNLFLILLILVTVILSSCIGQDREKYQENKSTVTITVTGTTLPTLIPTPTLVDIPTGITYEEHIRNNPPYPRNLTGTFKMNYVKLRWDVPEKVEFPHNYNDIIIRYNIYKGTREDNIRYLTSITEREFLDFNISDSQIYIYEITAVHEGEVESIPSEDVTVVK